MSELMTTGLCLQSGRSLGSATEDSAWRMPRVSQPSDPLLTSIPRDSCHPFKGGDHSMSQAVCAGESRSAGAEQPLAGEGLTRRWDSVEAASL
jgi:hypothetical protein